MQELAVELTADKRMGEGEILPLLSVLGRQPHRFTRCLIQYAKEKNFLSTHRGTIGISEAF